MFYRQGYEGRRESCYHYMESFFDLLLNFTTYTTFFALCLLLLSIGLSMLYLPFLKNFQKGCMESCQGTFLSRNAFSLSMNFVMADGEQKSLLSSKDYQKEVSYCFT